MPFPLLGAGISAGIGGLGGLLSNIFGSDKKEWTDADLAKFGWKDYDTTEANNLLLSNAANIINRRRSNANAKASQLGLDPVKSSWGMQEDVMNSVAGEAGNIYERGIQSSQNKAKILASLNANEEDDGDLFSDIFSGIGLGLNTFNKFYKANTGMIMPDEPGVPENKDVYPTMLAKKEGVLNAEAMSLPGVKEFVMKANKAGLSLRKKNGLRQMKNEEDFQERGDEFLDDIDYQNELIEGRQEYEEGNPEGRNNWGMVKARFLNDAKKRGMKDGGVIGEARRSDDRKKSRKGKGSSLRDRISDVFVDNKGNIGDLMNEVGFGTLHNLSSGNELPNDLDPKTMNLFEIINGLSTLSGDNEIHGDKFHRIEAGMEYNPLEGFRFKTGRAPNADEMEQGVLGVMPRTSNDPRLAKSLRMKLPLSLNIHTHDDDQLPSDTDIFNDTDNMSSFISSHEGPSQWDKNSGFIKTWDYDGKKKKKRVGMHLGNVPPRNYNILEEDLYRR